MTHKERFDSIGIKPPKGALMYVPRHYYCYLFFFYHCTHTYRHRQTDTYIQTYTHIYIYTSSHQRAPSCTYLGQTSLAPLKNHPRYYY